jgi:hypothetical protein
VNYLTVRREIREASIEKAGRLEDRQAGRLAPRSRSGKDWKLEGKMLDRTEKRGKACIGPSPLYCLLITEY